MEDIKNSKSIEEKPNVMVSIANFVNQLAELILPQEKCFKFEQIVLDHNSFELVQNIISNFKDACQAPKDNKKWLLLELFECYFLDEKSFKRIEFDVIDEFSDMMKNYKNLMNFWLKSKNEIIFNQSEEAKIFDRLLSKIPNLETFFVNIGIRLLSKKGYTLENILIYTIYSLTSKNNFNYNIKNLIQNTKELDYLDIANKFMSLIEKINFEDDLNNMQLIFQNNSFEFVPVEINIILKDLEVQDYRFPKTLKKRINQYIRRRDERKKENSEMMEKEKKQNESKQNKKNQNESKQNERVQNEQEKENAKSEEENKEGKKIILPEKRIENTINKNIEDNKYNELLLKIELIQKNFDKLQIANSELEKEIADLKNKNSLLKGEFDDYKINTNDKIEEYEETIQENKSNIKELKAEIKKGSNLMKLKIQKIENNEIKIKNLEKSNKEITSIIDSIKNWDLYKAIVDYINGLLSIKANEKYPIRIKNIILIIEKYINQKKIPSPNNFEKLINFLKELSKKITDSNQNAHILDPDSIEDKYILKIFPNYKELVNVFSKLSLVEGIKIIIKKKIAIINNNYKDSSTYEE